MRRLFGLFRPRPRLQPKSHTLDIALQLRQDQQRDVQVLALGRLDGVFGDVLLNVDARILLSDHLLQQRRVDPVAPRALDEAGMDRGRDRIRVVRVDAGSPEESLGADGFAIGVAEPRSRDAHRVSAVYLQWVLGARDRVRPDRDVEFGPDGRVEIWDGDGG